MDIPALQAFAQANGLDLTSPMSNGQVTRLARHWLPEIHFHWKEKYHPISLEEAIAMVEELFGTFPEEAKDSWRVSQWVREGSQAVRRLFDPPLVTVPSGTADPVGTTPTASDDHPIPTVRVISDEVPVRQAVEDAAVDAGARITHGASDSRSEQFFGSTVTTTGAIHPAPGDPLVPRAADDDVPQITVMAVYKNLLETLEYNLLTQAEDAYPPDALRTGFDIEGLIIQSALPMSTAQRRDVLLSMIAAHKAGNPLPSLPPGVTFDRLAWDTLTRYAFLEYYLFYAYNDFERYQTAIFDNEHEGDDEGFCLVFDRNIINIAASSADPDTLLTVPPYSIITSVHEEWQGGDEFRFIPTPTIPAESPESLREQLDLQVWVAGGSHATYLSEGTHDLVDFQDYTSWVDENAPWLWLVPGGAALILSIAITLHIIEHFVDTEDFTSDDGIHTGPERPEVGDPTAVRNRVTSLPMSAGDHIYQDRDLLRLAAFPGFWGGSNGFVDKSPPFIQKTGRYFRKLLRQL
jgi:hypothetical protein